jgi:hypothetical protein
MIISQNSYSYNDRVLKILIENEYFAHELKITNEEPDFYAQFLTYFLERTRNS